MKSLIVLVVGLLAVGCATVKDICVQLVGGKPNTPEQKQKALRDSMFGEYEWKADGNTVKWVFLDNGVWQSYLNGKKTGESKWSIVNKEIHIKYDSELIGVWRINADKSITEIAKIDDGKRTHHSKENQPTFKKIN